jgi:hypothetical protein
MQGSLKFNLVPKCCLVQPCVKLNIWKNLFWELLGFPQNSRLIPLPQARSVLLLAHGRIHEHLKFFSKHFKLQVIVIMSLNFLQKLNPKIRITNREMFMECWVLFFSHLFHCSINSYIFTVFIIELDCHICNGYQLPLQAKHECKKS